MKHLVLFVIIFSIAPRAVAQSLSETWLNGNHWKLYNTTLHESNQLSKDSLNYLQSIDLDTDTLTFLLKEADTIPKEKAVGAIWMSSYWVSYIAKGRLSLLRISSYGGFFIDENDGIYYELPIRERAEWLNYFSSASSRLLSKEL